MHRMRRYFLRIEPSIWDRGYDSYRKIFVYGYKIHIVLDVDTCLPICLARFRHRGIVWATAHAVLKCMSMLVAANAAIAVGKPDMMRSSA